MKSFLTKLKPTVFIIMIAVFATTSCVHNTKSLQEGGITGNQERFVTDNQDGSVTGKWQKGPNTNWFIYWNDALAEARTKNKAIFILSTGSDWCGWCKLLRKNVLDQEEFLDFANKNLVLLFLDSPSKNKLCSEQEQHNDYIRNSLGFSGGVPDVMIVSHQGDLLGEIGGGGDKLNEYLAKLKKILKGNSKNKGKISAQGKDLFTKGYLNSK